MKDSIKLEDHPEHGYLTIDGINFAYSIFKVFSVGPLGSPFMIKRREDGMVTCESYNRELEARLAEREKEIERLRGAIKKAIVRLGAPTMGYVPAIERRELKDSIEEVSTVLLVALERRDEGEGA